MSERKEKVGGRENGRKRCIYVCMYIHIYLSDEAMMAVKDGVRWGMRVEPFAQVCVRGNMCSVTRVYVFSRLQVSLAIFWHPARVYRALYEYTMLFLRVLFF